MNNPPNPTLIFETLNAHQKTGALKAAIELKLFTHLGDDSLSAAAIAEHCGADPRGMRILCDYLTIMGFLTKSEEAYSATPTSAVFLNENSPAYMGDTAGFIASGEIMDTFRDVAGAVRKGGTLLPDGGTTKVDHELWVEFARSMTAMMRPPAQFIAELLAQRTATPPSRVLDIAAGHGVFGITVAQQFSEAEIVAHDFEAVLAVAHENAEAAGVAQRYTLLPGDARSTPWEGRFDVVLLTNFLHHFDEATCTAILEKVQACLNPGGCVVTLEFIPNEDRVTPAESAVFALTMLTSTASGDAYTFREFERMFKAAGISQNELIDVPHSPQQLILSYV